MKRERGGINELGFSRQGLVGALAMLGLVLLAFVGGMAYNKAGRSTSPQGTAPATPDFSPDSPEAVATAGRSTSPQGTGSAAPDFSPDSPEAVAAKRDEAQRCAKRLSAVVDKFGAWQGRGNLRQLVREMFDGIEAEDLELSARESQEVVAIRRAERERLAKVVYAAVGKLEAEWLERERVRLQTELLQAQETIAKARRGAPEAKPDALTQLDAPVEPISVGGTGWAWYEEKAAEEREAKMRAAARKAELWAAQQEARDRAYVQDLEWRLQGLEEAQAVRDWEMQQRLRHQYQPPAPPPQTWEDRIRSQGSRFGHAPTRKR